eukprot:6033485-Pleurochrysis_carterae.AAC.1
MLLLLGGTPSAAAKQARAGGRRARAAGVDGIPPQAQPARRLRGGAGSGGGSWGRVPLAPENPAGLQQPAATGVVARPRGPRAAGAAALHPGGAGGGRERSTTPSLSAYSACAYASKKRWRAPRQS